jgi:hypothetical protein
MAAMESASVPEVTDAYRVPPSAESASPSTPSPESIVATCFPARLVTVISLLAAMNRASHSSLPPDDQHGNRSCPTAD